MKPTCKNIRGISRSVVNYKMTNALGKKIPKGCLPCKLISRSQAAQNT